MQRTIGDAAHRGVVTCAVDANAAQAAKTMLDNDVSALIVVDERLNACGVISKTDLIGLYGKELSSITAEDIMTSEIFTVSADTLVHEAVQLMLAHRIHQVVIVTEGSAHRRPVGIFTSGDVVALMAGESGPRSEAQIRCAECLRKLLSIGSSESTSETMREGGEQNTAKRPSRTLQT
jgi:CBS domain-containing protein